MVPKNYDYRNDFVLHVMLTTRCTMRCQHCSFSCEPGKGEDMATATAIQAIKTAQELDLVVALGGGEPTLHPDFEEILGCAVGMSLKTGLVPWIATNGSQEQRTKRMFPLATSGVVTVFVSNDRFHDRSQVSHDVLRMYREINRVFGEFSDADLVKMGRQKEGLDTRCAVPQLLVWTDGSVRLCSCADAPSLGHIGQDAAAMMRLALHTTRTRPGLLNCWKVLPEEDRWMIRQRLMNHQAEQAHKEYVT